MVFTAFAEHHVGIVGSLQHNLAVLQQEQQEQQLIHLSNSLLLAYPRENQPFRPNNKMSIHSFILLPPPRVPTRTQRKTQPFRPNKNDMNACI